MYSPSQVLCPTFAPKCHPELQCPIESSWAKMKGHIRRRCKHTLPSLRENIIAALQPDNIPLTLVQKWFRKMRDYMAAYEDGATGKTADKKVKQYRSHRQCFDKTPAGGSYLPEPIRLVERDSIIDLTEPPSVKRWHPPLSTSVKLECSTLRCFIWTGHWPPSAALSVPSALGRWKCPPAARGPARSPAVAQFTA